MLVDKKLWWRIWRRDLLFNMTWLPVGCLSVIMAALLFGLLQSHGWLTGEGAVGWYGIGMLAVGATCMWLVSKLLAKRFGVRCPTCHHIVSMFAMDGKRRKAFWRTRECPYCKEMELLPQYAVGLLTVNDL